METQQNTNESQSQRTEEYIRLLMLNDKRIYGYILSVVPVPSDADDIMQETCAVMWKKFSNFKPGMDFVLWAITVARYQIYVYFQNKKRSKVCYSDSLMDDLQDRLIQDIPQMDDRLDALKNCIQKLTEHDR